LVSFPRSLIGNMLLKYGKQAILRLYDGKQAKWNRAWKIALIEKENPEWRDLYPDLVNHGQYPR
jgi:predicted GIY-YIG superfamily endonuclease